MLKSEAGAYLEAVLASPPGGQLLWWHINNAHDVTHLQEIATSIPASARLGGSTAQMPAFFCTAKYCQAGEQLHQCSSQGICRCTTELGGRRVTTLHNTQNTAAQYEMVL